MTIKLIVADIDGCFTHGGRAPLDLDLLAEVRRWNEESRTDATVPALVFCTGRPLPYVQAMHQAAGIHHLPSLAECGAVMWCPRTRRHLEHPAFGPVERRHFHELSAHAEEELLGGDGLISIEAGKFCQLTLFPIPPLTMSEMLARVEVFAARWSERFVVDRTLAVVNFLPPAINKGTGLEWLASREGIALSEMIGVGDSASDWDFMGRCGISAAPANAVPELKAKSTWVLESGPVDCIREVHARAVQLNKSR